MFERLACTYAEFASVDHQVNARWNWTSFSGRDSWDRFPLGRGARRCYASSTRRSLTPTAARLWMMRRRGGQAQVVDPTGSWLLERSWSSRPAPPAFSPQPGQTLCVAACLLMCRACLLRPARIGCVPAGRGSPILGAPAGCDVDSSRNLYRKTRVGAKSPGLPRHPAGFRM